MLTCSSQEAWGAVVWLASVLRRMFHCSGTNTKTVFSFLDPLSLMAGITETRPVFILNLMGYAIAIFHSILCPFLVSLYVQVLHCEEILRSVRSWVEKKGGRDVSVLSSHKHFPSTGHIWGEIWHPVLGMGMWEDLILQGTPLTFMWQLAFPSLYWLQSCMEEHRHTLFLNFFYPNLSQKWRMYRAAFICT